MLSVSKDIGEAVKAGELLIEIDAPDLKQAVEQKQAIILQREKELSAAVADKLVAQKAVDAAKVGVRVKGLEVKRRGTSLPLGSSTSMPSQHSTSRARS